jgi:hypothetical protein
MSKFEQSEEWAKKGLLQAEKYELHENIALFYFILSKVASAKKQYQQSVQFGKQSQKIYEKLEHSCAIVVSNWLKEHME